MNFIYLNILYIKKNMIFESKTKSKISSKNIFNDDFLKEKDDALKPLDFLFESNIENEDIYLSSKKIENTKQKIHKFKSNIIIIESEPENSSESTFNLEREIEKINSLLK